MIRTLILLLKNLKYQFKVSLKIKQIMKTKLPVHNSVTVLLTCCMAKFIKLSFDLSPWYFTAAYIFIYKKRNIFYFLRLGEGGWRVSPRHLVGGRVGRSLNMLRSSGRVPSREEGSRPKYQHWRSRETLV